MAPHVVPCRPSSPRRSPGAASPHTPRTRQRSKELRAGIPTGMPARWPRLRGSARVLAGRVRTALMSSHELVCLGRAGGVIAAVTALTTTTAAALAVAAALAALAAVLTVLTVVRGLRGLLRRVRGTLVGLCSAV